MTNSTNGQSSGLAGRPGPGAGAAVGDGPAAAVDEKVDVGACVARSNSGSPQPPFDAPVPGGRECVASREVADADQHQICGAPSGPSALKPT
jgi:hypothetical protein